MAWNIGAREFPRQRHCTSSPHPLHQLEEDSAVTVNLIPGTGISCLPDPPDMTTMPRTQHQSLFFPFIPATPLNFTSQAEAETNLLDQKARFYRYMRESIEQGLRPQCMRNSIV